MRPLVDKTPLESLYEQLRVFRQIHPKTSDKFAFNDINDLLLKRGTVYRAQDHEFPVWPRACFDEAFRRATRRGSRWVYVEGYGVNPDAPLAVPHAWISPIDQPGVAIDTAWGYKPDAGYLGIAFDPEYVRRMHKLSGEQYYSVIDAWWAGHPLITGEHKLEDVIWRPK